MIHAIGVYYELGRKVAQARNEGSFTKAENYTKEYRRTIVDENLLDLKKAKQAYDEGYIFQREV